MYTATRAISRVITNRATLHDLGVIVASRQKTTISSGMIVISNTIDKLYIWGIHRGEVYGTTFARSGVAAKSTFDELPIASTANPHRTAGGVGRRAEPEVATLDGEIHAICEIDGATMICRTIRENTILDNYVIVAVHVERASVCVRISVFEP